MMKKRVLVVAAHPDDEVLGCGATVISHVAAGNEVRAVIACEGESLRYMDREIHMCQYTEKAASILGYSSVNQLGFPDQQLDTFSLIEIITPLEKIILEYKPNVIYCQAGCDINRDHKILFESTMVAVRPKITSVEEILAFYTVGSSEWNYPRQFVPDTWHAFGEDVLQQKLRAFACYESEIYAYPNPRSMKALENVARFYGNQICVEYAEVFMTIRRRISI